jgi:hypothetical protein
MKLSTLVFISLLAALFIAPFLVAGSYYFFPAGEPVVVVNKDYRVLRINNPSLKRADVVISAEDVKRSTLRSYSRKESRTLYYLAGKIKYPPDVWDQEDTLYVGNAPDAADGLPLSLHVPAGELDLIFLNGETIYERRSGRLEP